MFDADGVLFESFESNIAYYNAIFAQVGAWWLGFLREAAPAIEDLFNSNTAAVLFLTIDQRKFAIPFGYGRNLLALDSLARDFGLKVALHDLPRYLEER